MSRSADDRFSSEILPHLDAAYALARWLCRDENDAEDIVQEALVRALRFIDAYEGLNARAWLLAIVRNTAYTWLKKNRSEDLRAMDEDAVSLPSAGQATPDVQLIRGEYREQIRTALQSLPIQLREVLLLREIEGMPYKSIAEIIGSPIGTVMSRLSRARVQLSALLTPILKDI